MYKQRTRMVIDEIWAPFNAANPKREEALNLYYQVHKSEANRLESNEQFSSLRVRIAKSYLRLYNAFELMRLTNSNCRGLVKGLTKVYGIPIGRAFADGVRVITPRNGIQGTLGELSEKRIFHVNYYELPKYEEFIRLLLARPEFDPQSIIGNEKESG